MYDHQPHFLELAQAEREFVETQRELNEVSRDLQHVHAQELALKSQRENKHARLNDLPHVIQRLKDEIGAPGGPAKARQ